MAGADSGEAGTGTGAVAGSARRGAAGAEEGRIDAGDAVSFERREPIRRGGCGGGPGARDLVGPAAVMDFEDSGNDGNFAQRIPVGCRKPQVRRGELPGE